MKTQQTKNSQDHFILLIHVIQHGEKTTLAILDKNKGDSQFVEASIIFSEAMKTQFQERYIMSLPTLTDVIKTLDVLIVTEKAITNDYDYYFESYFDFDKYEFRFIKKHNDTYFADKTINLYENMPAFLKNINKLKYALQNGNDQIKPSNNN